MKAAGGNAQIVAAQQLAAQEHLDMQIKDGYEKIRGDLLDKGVVAFQENGTITVAKKIEPKDDPKIEDEIKRHYR